MNPLRKMIIGGTLVAATLGGGAIGASLVNGVASADTTSPTATVPAAPAQVGQPPQNAPAPDWTKDGHVGQNGTKETSITGDTADKIKAAAEAAVPGGTVQRIENDAEGSPYEAHMTKSDGSIVTVKLDDSFNVTSVLDGMG